jgi:hypothetical protein
MRSGAASQKRSAVPAPLRLAINSLTDRLPAADVRVSSRRDLCEPTAAAGLGQLNRSKAGRRGQLLVGRR